MKFFKRDYVRVAGATSAAATRWTSVGASGFPGFLQSGSRGRRTNGSCPYPSCSHPSAAAPNAAGREPLKAPPSGSRRPATTPTAWRSPCLAPKLPSRPRTGASGNSPRWWALPPLISGSFLPPLAGINLQYGLTAHRAEQVKTLEVDDGLVELRAITGPDYGRIYDHELVEAVQRIAGDGTSDTRWKVPGVLDWSTSVYNPRVNVRLGHSRVIHTSSARSLPRSRRRAGRRLNAILS